MERAWALFGRWAWLLLVATGVALVWKWGWGSVSGGHPASDWDQIPLQQVEWEEEEWVLPPPQ